MPFTLQIHEGVKVIARVAVENIDILLLVILLRHYVRGLSTTRVAKAAEGRVWLRLYPAYNARVIAPPDPCQRRRTESRIRVG